MKDVSQYHRHLVDKYGELEVWEVDGENIRQHLDIEFPNFAMWPDFSYIPKNELWLDVEKNPDERQFFIDHMLAQWIVLRSGGTNDEALNKAYRVERSERRKAGDKSKVFDGSNHPHPETVHVKKLGQTTTGLDIWIINGRLVRSSFFIDFMDGGHHLIYPWIPANEVWIDDDLVKQEIPFVLLHELHERALMTKGFSYNKAHPEASKIELFCHHHQSKLSEELEKLGWRIS